uniref:Uncharacterized protein n=1 Tax=Cacopsylla melanoneura TaxID=428564 RepID=A0A8D9EHA0_9HEMI
MVSKELSFQMSLPLAIILTSFICFAATKEPDILVDKINKTLAVVDLCVAGKTATCTGLTLDQATSVCGKEFNDHIRHNARYTKFNKVLCVGRSCHAELATNDSVIYGVLDCTQDGNHATCACQVYNIMT